MGLYEYHIVHLAILSDALKVASRNEKLCSYMLRGLWKSAVNIVFHSEGRKHIKQRVKTNIERGVSMDIVLWRMSVCVDLEDCTQLSPVLVLGDFSVFHSKK